LHENVRFGGADGADCANIGVNMALTVVFIASNVIESIAKISI
jgi:hypothetical protein